MKENRKSNLEMLRVVAMIMIVAYHIFFHCINVQLTDVNLIGKLGNSYYCNPRFSWKLSMLALIAPMGQIGNAIFFLLSGYFMINNISINLIKTSKKLLGQLFFFIIVLSCTSICAYKFFRNNSIMMIPFSAFNSLSWFIGWYYIVILSAKLFLNNYLSGLSCRQYLAFVLISFSLLQFGYSASILANLHIDVIFTGIFLYSLGGYIKLYDPFKAIKSICLNAIIIINFNQYTNYWKLLCCHCREYYEI